MLTQEQQSERVAELKHLLGNLNRIENLVQAKGKTLTTFLQSYLAGWSDGKGEPVDPIIYIAMLRGGDPRKEIENGIKLITA